MTQVAPCHIDLLPFSFSFFFCWSFIFYFFLSKGYFHKLEIAQTAKQTSIWSPRLGKNTTTFRTFIWIGRENKKSNTEKQIKTKIEKSPVDTTLAIRPTTNNHNLQTIQMHLKLKARSS